MQSDSDCEGLASAQHHPAASAGRGIADLI
jgi:hypothetical protein